MPVRLSRAQRVGLILDRLGATERVGATDLARELGVSSATVRRDLTLLAEHRLVARVYGGALAEAASDELPVRYRVALRRDQKRAIAKHAAGMLPCGPLLVGLTGGTTTRELGRLIATRVGLTVVTNALDVAAELARNPRITVVVTGGTTRPLSGELVGPLVARTLAPLRLDVAVIGADGVAAVGGVTTHDPAEAAANAAMVAAAHRVIVVADGSKLGRATDACIVPAGRIDDLITDSDADEAAVAALRALTRVHVVT